MHAFHNCQFNILSFMQSIHEKHLLFGHVPAPKCPVHSTGRHNLIETNAERAPAVFANGPEIIDYDSWVPSEWSLNSKITRQELIILQLKVRVQGMAVD